jgi:hypothetical protein
MLCGNCNPLHVHRPNKDKTLVIDVRGQVIQLPLNATHSCLAAQAQAPEAPAHRHVTYKPA